MVASGKGLRKDRGGVLLQWHMPEGPSLTLSCIESSVSMPPKAQWAAGCGGSQARVCESLPFQEIPVCSQQLLLGWRKVRRGRYFLASKGLLGNIYPL